MPRRLDLTNQRFGRLIAVEPSGRSARGVILWLFRCSCGNKIKRSVADVKRGNTKSCGCLKSEKARESNVKMLTLGSLFGRWKILKYLGTNPFRHSIYKVECVCGDIREVTRQSLVEGTSVSCGCYMIDRLKERLTTHGLSKTKEYKAERTRARRAKRKINGGAHTLEETIHLRYNIQNNRCHYCNKSLDLFETIHEDHKIPISKDGSNGIENIAISCPPCNLKKHTQTDEEFELSMAIGEVNG